MDSRNVEGRLEGEKLERGSGVKSVGSSLQVFVRMVFSGHKNRWVWCDDKAGAQFKDVTKMVLIRWK